MFYIWNNGIYEKRVVWVMLGIIWEFRFFGELRRKDVVFRVIRIFLGLDVFFYIFNC